MPHKKHRVTWTHHVDARLTTRCSAAPATVEAVIRHARATCRIPLRQAVRLVSPDLDADPLIKGFRSHTLVITLLARSMTNRQDDAVVHVPALPSTERYV